MYKKSETLTADEAQQLNEYIGEVRREMKPKSKNELIRIIAALLVDKISMQGMIEHLQAPKAEAAANEVP